MILVNVRPIANDDVVEREAALLSPVVPAMSAHPCAQQAPLGDEEMG